MQLDDFVHPSHFGWYVVVASAAYVLYQLGVVVYNLWFHPLAGFPGPKLRAAFYFPDALTLINGNQHLVMKDLHDKYGDVVRISPDHLSYSTAQAWQDIYGHRIGKKQLPKDGKFYSFARPIKELAPSIIYTTDADHARIRRLLSHAFSDAAIREQEPLLNVFFDLFIKRLNDQIDGPAEGKVNLVDWFNFVTFDIIGDLALGESFHALEGGKYHPWVRAIFLNIKNGRWIRLGKTYPIFGFWLESLFKISPAIRAKVQAHRQYSYQKTEDRLNKKMDRKDFVTYVQRYNDERGMTKKEIQATFTTLLVAGTETTATTLSGCVYHLCKYPEVLKRLQSEVRGAFASAEEITFVDTAKLTYLHAVLEESMRMYPAVPVLLPRITPPQGEVICDRFVPGNTSLGVYQYAAYHNAKNFADPEVFVPERWLESPPEKYANDERGVFQPFSIGPRNCIGKNLAYNELRAILARLIWNFDFELCPESENWTYKQESYLLWEKPALEVVLKRREGVRKTA